jgi:hypothetical protein
VIPIILAISIVPIYFLEEDLRRIKAESKIVEEISNGAKSNIIMN